MSSEPDPSDIAQLWKDAIEAYEKETKSDLECDLDSDDVPECTDVESVINVLQENMEVFKKFRSSDSKWGKVRGVLERVVSVVLALNDVAGDAAAASGTPGGSVIFVGIGKLLSATKGVSDTYDSLQELFSQLSDYLLRLSTRLEVRTGLSSAARKNALDVLVHLLHVLALATKLLKKNRFMHYLDVVSGNKDMKDALAKLDKLTTIETRVAITETLVTSQQVLAEVHNLVVGGQVHSEALEHIKTQLTVLVDTQQDADAYKWLAPPDPSVNHRRVTSSRYEGTGTWMLNSPTFLQWRERGASSFWLYGKPGSGKSVLCSTVIDMLTATPSSVVAYFYFDFRDEAKQNAHGMLRSLVHQLSSASADCRSLHREFYARYVKKGSPSLELLMDHLRCLVATLSSPVYLVVDAIDECPLDTRRNEVLPFLGKLGCLHFSHVRVLMASRPEMDIRIWFEGKYTVSMNLQDVVPHEHDMKSYITHVLTSDLDFGDWPERLVVLACETLQQEANGMFRWVALQLDSLRKCLPKHVEKALGSLPKTMGE
ncbi:hypothetical protein PENSPDRAFT_736446, partial [Peniophora sp. CONT]